MATLKDVAQLAGVTVTTVSRMMNGRQNVSQKTRDKIEDAMAALGYHPNDFARSLAKKSSNFIGLIVPSAQNFFFSSVIESVEAYVSANGCKLLLCVSNLDAQKEKEYFNMLLSNKVMGIILASYTQNSIDPAHLDAPLIAIERSISPQVPSVLTDNYNGGRLAANHLIDKGCRHLLYYSGNAMFPTDPYKRYLGLRDVCHERGLPLPPSIDSPMDEFITMDYDASVATIFEQYPQTDGILASNDIMAASIVRYCQRHGIRVPEDIKVVGYDNSPFAANCTFPLTTIHQPVDELCRFAVESIIRSANGEIVPTCATFPVSLIERETT